MQYAQCGNCCDLVSHVFGKNFVKVTVLLHKLPKSWVDEIFVVFSHCDAVIRFAHCWNYRNLLSLKNFRQINYLVISLVKILSTDLGTPTDSNYNANYCHLRCPGLYFHEIFVKKESIHFYYFVPQCNGCERGR